MKGTTRSVAPQVDTQRSRQSQGSANRKDNTLCTPTNVLTATASIAPPASPLFHHPCDLSGTKTRSPRLFNTTRACSGSTRGGGKDITATACSATRAKKSNSDWLTFNYSSNLHHRAYFASSYKLLAVSGADFITFILLSVWEITAWHYSCLLMSLK